MIHALVAAEGSIKNVAPINVRTPEQDLDWYTVGRNDLLGESFLEKFFQFFLQDLR
jgi:hypothetical protein